MSQDVAGVVPDEMERDPSKKPYFLLPGCGLAAYVGVLAMFFVIGMSGLVLWTMTVFSAGDGARLDNLTYGGHVPASVVIPMFEAGLLKPGEVPDLFHTEVFDGSTACAVVGQDIVRVSPTEKARFPIREIKEVKGDDLDVIVVGPQTFTCRFAEGTGGDRFAHILRGESE